MDGHVGVTEIYEAGRGMKYCLCSIERDAASRLASAFAGLLAGDEARMPPLSAGATHVRLAWLGLCFWRWGNIERHLGFRWGRGLKMLNL
jgi:hypothetical protein